MSIFSIKQYLSEIEKVIHYGGTGKETAIRNGFYNLLNEYLKPKNLILITELAIKTKDGKTIMPDGTIKDALRQDWGYWESKDEADNIDDEIAKKFAKGYPKDNILFEDSQTAVLYQNGFEIMRVSMKDPEMLDSIIRQFINFERPEVTNFRKAIELFKQDVPKVTSALRDMIAREESNIKFVSARSSFLELCQKSINPAITVDDVNEMMLQHILTADIFNRIFDEPYFHHENNIAKELENVLDTFFTGTLRKQALSSIQHYFEAINASAAGIADHHEKQKFLKIVYETFYKSYNPKAADRLGVVYTPNEIVNFMIESTDYLLHKHFGKGLEDKGVEILDPATGTGTFICDIIDYIRKDKLAYKYEHEIHANEVAILPYYIANLNIEFTYKQKIGAYKEFENLCFVDTLDNMGFAFSGKQEDMFGFSSENIDRIKKQNKKKISVIIGNPPYNANQQNENDNNKNREYREIDKRIKDTFIKNSTAQKTKVYDMYARFYRWAMDRIDENGVICYITNNSFINSRTFDGFRKSIQEEFDYAYIIDLGGNIRELSGKDGIFLNERHTIFGVAAAVGIAMMFLIKSKKDSHKDSIINHIHPCDIRATRDEKLEYLAGHKFNEIPFDNITPDKKNNWINLSDDNDWEELLPVCSKNNSENSIFKFSSLGVSTNRDEWVYDFDKNNLINKIKYFTCIYNELLNQNDNSWQDTIKWSSTLKSIFLNKKNIEYQEDCFKIGNYRPYVKMHLYSHKSLNDRLTQNHYEIFGNELSLFNKGICFSGLASNKKFQVIGINTLWGLDFLEKTQCLPLYRYDQSGNRIDNITDWGLARFIERYEDEKIGKEDIFHYVYGVLHNPEYRKKYELNLKRDFPRIPFYEVFWVWSSRGKELMDLHINYESVEPYNLTEVTTDEKENPKCKLKADKDNGVIILDENTLLKGVPAEAWLYKLGNRSALEWILDQYKEKKPSDPTIAEKFNTYKFADYKTQVIDLLKRVCTVSVETMRIIGAMEN